MNIQNDLLLLLGLPVLLGALLVLYQLVKELEVTQHRRWLLGLAIGFGVFSFAIKLVLIVIINQIPETWLSPDISEKHQRNTTTSTALSQNQIIKHSNAIVWEPLPLSAPYPADNPPTPDLVLLGKKLFFDTRLSANNRIACASCHKLTNDKGGSDGQNLPSGIHHQPGKRNVPTVFNAAFQRVLFWDGRATSLETQARGPLTNPIEMGMPSLEAVEQRVQNLDEYLPLFSAAFPATPEISIDNITRAIATFERTLITPDSAYDRFVRGNIDALTPQQLLGMALFETVGCIFCHSGPNFSDASVFSNNSGFRLFPTHPEPGIILQYQLLDDRGVAENDTTTEHGIWRVPSLRNVSRTAPYFHNGAVDNLEDAVRIMARLQLGLRLSNENTADTAVLWSTETRQLTRLNNQVLNDTEIQAIVAFLESLNGEIPKHLQQDTEISNK